MKTFSSSLRRIQREQVQSPLGMPESPNGLQPANGSRHHGPRRNVSNPNVGGSWTFEPRTTKPKPPFFWQREDEVQFIEARYGKAYEKVVWGSLVRMANSARSPTFHATITDIAWMAGCRYRKAESVLHWLALIGLVKISKRRSPTGNLYTLQTVSRALTKQHAHDRRRPPARDAEDTPARHADSLQQNTRSRNLQAPPTSLGTDNQSRAVQTSHQECAKVTPESRLKTESEPILEESRRAKELLSRYSPHAAVRFVATNNPNGKLTTTLQDLVGAVPAETLSDLAAYVYAKGNTQKPPWNPGQRAAALTVRLKANADAKGNNDLTCGTSR